MLPKHEPNKDNSKYANMDREKPRRPQPQHRKLQAKAAKVESKRNSLPQGRTHQLLIQ